VREVSYCDFLGELSKQYLTVAISGTNGKSTTTAMLGLILERAGLDPTVIVGSKVKTFPDGNLRLGKSKYLVVEACEYNAHMLKIQPQMIVLTNVEEDHLDFYRDLNHIKETFVNYIKKLSNDGFLIYNSDDCASEEVVRAIGNSQLTISNYGVDLPADYMAKNILIKPGHQYFDILRTTKHEEVLGSFSLQIPGRFNIYNALAAVSAALNLGILPEIIKETLENFSGIWRRFEKVGERGGAIIISDYGHHPTAIRETVQAAREFYPDRRIVLVFQPHQRNRTRRLFDDFVQALLTPDILVLTEIYDVTGREDAEDAAVSSQQLFDEIKKTNTHLQFAKNLDEAERMTRAIIVPNDIVIVMGAGDIDKIARKFAH